MVEGVVSRLGESPRAQLRRGGGGASRRHGAGRGRPSHGACRGRADLGTEALARRSSTTRRWSGGRWARRIRAMRVCVTAMARSLGQGAASVGSGTGSRATAGRRRVDGGSTAAASLDGVVADAIAPGAERARTEEGQGGDGEGEGLGGRVHAGPGGATTAIAVVGDGKSGVERGEGAAVLVRRRYRRGFVFQRRHGAGGGGRLYGAGKALHLIWTGVVGEENGEEDGKEGWQHREVLIRQRAATRACPSATGQRCRSNTVGASPAERGGRLTEMR